MADRGPVLKDPAAVLDYVFDWRARTNRSKSTDWLASGEVISSHTVTVASGDVTVDSSGETDSDTSVTAWISGGTAGTDALVVCQITTDAGRTDERTLKLKVRQR